MDVVGQSLHTGRKALGVRLNEAPLVPLSMPAVIDVDVLVASILHPGRDHRIGGLSDELLVDVAGEGVPTVPAHRRRLGQILELLGERDGRDQQRDRQQQLLHGIPPRLVPIQSIPATIRVHCLPVLTKAGTEAGHYSLRFLSISSIRCVDTVRREQRIGRRVPAVVHQPLHSRRRHVAAGVAGGVVEEELA